MMRSRREGVGRKRKEESVLVFIALPFRFVGCPHVVAYGISSIAVSPLVSSRRLVHHLVIVSLPVCLFRFAPRASRSCVSFVLLVARLVVLFFIACLVSSLCISSLLPHAIVFTPAPTVSGIASHIVLPSASLCVPYEKPTPTSW